MLPINLTRGLNHISTVIFTVTQAKLIISARHRLKMPLFLGGSRHIKVHFHEPVVTDHLTLMKLVLERIKRGDFQWFIEEPVSDYYTYHFEVKVPATVEEEDAVKAAAIDYLSSHIEDVQYYAGRREAEASLQTAVNGNILGRIKNEVYGGISLQGNHSLANLMCQNLTDADVISTSSSSTPTSPVGAPKKDEGKDEDYDCLELESVCSSFSSYSDFEEYRKKRENLQYFEKENLITSYGSQSDLDLTKKWH